MVSKRFRGSRTPDDDTGREIGPSLVGLVLAAVLPLLVFSVGVAWMIVDQKKGAVEAELAGMARALRVAVDRELLSHFSTLEVLANDVSLDVHNLAAFGDSVRRVLKTHGSWRNAVLIEPNSHEIVASGLPISVPAPTTTSPAAVDQVVRTRQPMIVGLLPSGRMVKKPIIQFLVPVMRRDEVRFVLGLAMDPKPLNDLFVEQGFPPSWTGAIVDEHMTLAGRSRDPERYVGNRATTTLVERIGSRESGLFSALNQEGATVYTVFNRSPLTGWSVAIGVPAAELEGPIQSVLLLLGSASGALILVPLALTGMVGRAIVRRRNAYERALQDEIAERKRTASIIDRERVRLRTILKTASDGIHILDGEGFLVEANEAFLDMLGYDASMIGKLHMTDWDAGSSAAEFKAHMDDLIARRAQAVFETRHRRSDRRFIDVEINASGIEIDGKAYLYAASRDITARKQAEQQLRIAATAFESPLGLAVTDANSVILRVNEAFTRITGYTVEEVVGRKTSMLKSGRHDATFYQAMWDSIRKNGSWQGEIWNRRKNGELYPEWLTITAVRGSAGEVSNYVATLADITQRKAAEDEIRHLAFYDPLTQLPNRRLLLDRLHRALASSARSGRAGALLFIDLDNFKTLNDTLGHHIGDLLLQQVAGRLGCSIREVDTVARLGGDEFVVMLEELNGNLPQAAAQTESVGRKILEALNEPYELDGHPHHSTPSIGATLFLGQQEATDELLKRADLAMYQAKAAGRNTICFFDPEMQASIAARVALEANLRRAIQQNQFVLYYQPQVEEGFRVIGAEALVRWQHPEQGIILPGAFIPLAEEIGMILPLGQLILESACTQLAKWADHPDLASISVAVNVSAKQFHHPDFVDQVSAILDKTGADPRRLNLELTESLLLSDVEDVIAKMAALGSKGVSFSLDDFGTGYSSLSYLKRLPLCRLKIDQSFVRDILADPSDAAIAGTIVALARHLGLRVIAEGVESEEQRQFLSGLGCNAFQGYLFSRPVPVEDFEAYFLRAGERQEMAG